MCEGSRRVGRRELRLWRFDRGAISMRLHPFRASLGFFLGRYVADLLTMAALAAVWFALWAFSRPLGG